MSDDDDWRDHAACKDKPGHIFFPEKGETATQAKAVCAGCPVVNECLSFALDEEIRHGVWGGRSEKERRRMRQGRTHVATCKRCGRMFNWVRNSTGNTRPVYCSLGCRRDAKNRRSAPVGRPPGFARDVPHSPCDETDVRDRSAYSAIYPEGDWGMSG